MIASFGAPAAGAVFVPVNPLLKPEQVAFILRDCNVRVLVTSPERLALMKDALTECHDLRHVIVTDAVAGSASVGAMVSAPLALVNWSDLLASPPQPGHRVIDTDIVAILYTSGSTGKPKGVVLSHRNMVAGAKSVASYLENSSQDTLLAALPLITVLTLIWLYVEQQPEQKIANHAWYTFWYVLPTLPMFLAFPVLLPRLGFWPSLLACLIICLLCFALFALVLRRIGIQLF